ncbi:MAG: ABC transporter substrate-binding protein [Firmicutes bacterium]|nr:ABC transporter substrate-binding protein [Bacillota bacterium]
MVSASIRGPFGGKFFTSVFLVGLLVMLFSSLSLAAGRYNEAPMLAELVKQNKLPSVEKRLPNEPLEVAPVEEVGQYGGVLRILHTNPQNFEDAVNAVGKESMLAFNRDDGRSIVPNIAKSWEFSKDGKTLTLHLRRGIKWSDGKPFTADDILFWYEDVVLNDEITPVKPKIWSPGDKLMALQKVDDYTVRLSFSKPYSAALIALAAWATEGNFYLPKHYLKNYHPRYVPKEKLEEMAKKAGYDSWYRLFQAKAAVDYFGGIQNPEAPVIRAFKPVKSAKELTILERNPYYWKVDTAGNQLPYIDEIRLTLVQNIEVYTMKVVSGEVDLAQWNTTLDNYPVYKENAKKAGYRVLLYKTAWPSMAEFFLNMNHKDPVLRKIIEDRRFRIAMSLAMNRDEINEMVFHGMGEPLQTVILPRGGRFWDEKLAKLYTEHDPARANKLLDEMGLNKRAKDGYRLRPDGKVLALTIEYWPGEGGPAKRSIVELVQRYWESVGVKTVVKESERNLLQVRRQAGDHDVTLWHTGQCSDPLWILNPYHYIPVNWECSFGPQWVIWYTSGGKSGEEPPEDVKKALKLWETTMTSLDEKEVARAGKEMLRIFVENLWGIGTVGLMPWPVVANEKLRNIPETGLLAWDWVYLARYNPEQFFFKK